MTILETLEMCQAVQLSGSCQRIVSHSEGSQNLVTLPGRC